jgi:hypothetical protein
MTRIIKIEEESAKLPVRIRLKGKWLERAGFKPGTHAQVQVEFGRLIISAPTDAPEIPDSTCVISSLTQ